DPGGHVAVLPEHLADGAAAPRQDAGVAVVARGRFGDAAERAGLVVAAGDERGPRWAAQGGRVETVVPQSLGRQPLHGGRWHAAGEGAELAEPRVVDKDQDDVGRALRSLHRLRELWLVRVEVGAADISGKVEVRLR